MYIHPFFHVSLLEMWAYSSILGQIVASPPPIPLVDGPKFKVEAILQHKLYFFVDPLRYCPSDQSWEPIENLDNDP